MKLRAIRTPAQLSGFRTRADGSMGFTCVTPEISTEEKVALMELDRMLVELLIYPNDEKDVEVVNITKTMDCKTPSQRLRAVLFLWYKQSKDTGTFQAFYDRKMEMIINSCKAKLDGDPK